MLIQLVGLLFAVTSTCYSYNTDEQDTYDFECSISSQDYSAYDKNLLFEDRNPNVISIFHPTNVYDPTSYSWDITYDYVFSGATYHFDLGHVSLIFEYSNSQYTYSVTPTISISCDNSDYEFTYYNILPVYTIECATSSEYFNFTKTIYDTQYCSLATTYDYSVTLPTQTLAHSVHIETSYAKLTCNLISLSEVDLSENYTDGFNKGFYEGQSTGYDKGLTDGKSQGFQDGFDKAKSIYENQDENISAIFSGILNIGMIPVSFLMAIFNFEIFGINIASIVGALLTIAVVVIILRIVLGGKNKGE